MPEFFFGTFNGKSKIGIIEETPLRPWNLHKRPENLVKSNNFVSE